MKKQNVSKVELDLDAALEEVAKKLRPSANAPGCGNTNWNGTRQYTAQSPGGSCSCYCCSNN